ncbi:MAG TPA: alpha/beta fold hydrolase [Gaiellaceae bacterium]|nr:alpha/beta fold hydrolase [Gaiellaceae bacterium]
MGGTVTDSWFQSGERVPAGEHTLFARVSGAGPWLTFLHAFPTSSWDWSRVVPLLEGAHRCLCPDFLGFGDSDKPRRHRYSIVEQADLVEALWGHFGVTETFVVAHDYGATVAQELMARHGAGGRLTGVVLMNGALYVDLARPLLVQRLLATPGVGPLVARLAGYRAFARGMASVFSEEHPLSDEELREHWRVLARQGGTAPIAHRLSHYLRDRADNAGRWEAAIEQTALPLTFVWGMADPRSGAHIAERIRERVPHASFVALERVGHYPQLEVPARVAGEVARVA